MIRIIHHLASIAANEKQIISIKHAIRACQGRNFFVFGSPYHSNLGDQAQSYCIERWANRNYPEYQVFIFDTQFISFHKFQLLSMIRKEIQPTDKIFLHSGYHTTDLYMLEENMQRHVVQMFPDMRIVILPQTIFYKNPDEAAVSERIYNAHPNLHFLCRDDVSYEKAQQMFPHAHLLKFPDIVTTMIGAKHYDHERKGILLVMRNDKEAFYKPEQIQQLKSNLSDIDIVKQTDTTVDFDAKYIIAHRREVLEQTWDNYSRYRVIITDRYHGTIFSLVAGTPVLVLSSTDHKLSSGVKWFPPEFSDYVRFIPDLSEVRTNVERVYASNLDHTLPPYFEDNYYSKLKTLIGD